MICCLTVTNTAAAEVSELTSLTPEYLTYSQANFPPLLLKTAAYFSLSIRHRKRKAPTHQHSGADGPELRLHLLPIVLDKLHLLVAGVCLLLDAGDNPPGRASPPHHILVGHREQVALLVGQLGPLLRHRLHAGGHVVVALGLLRQLGFLDQLGLIHGGRRRGEGSVVAKAGEAGDVTLPATERASEPARRRTAIVTPGADAEDRVLAAPLLGGGYLLPIPRCVPWRSIGTLPPLGRDRRWSRGPPWGSDNPETQTQTGRGSGRGAVSCEAAPAYQSGFLSSPRAPRASTPKCCLLGTRSRTPSSNEPGGPSPRAFTPQGRAEERRDTEKDV